MLGFWAWFLASVFAGVVVSGAGWLVLVELGCFKGTEFDGQGLSPFDELFGGELVEFDEGVAFGWI